MTKSTYLYKLSIFFTLFVLLFSVFHYVHAQAYKKASITLNKNYPTPGQGVIANFIAPSLDMDTTFITWRINGEVVDQGYAKNKLSFDVGNVGTFYNISVSAQDASGNKLTGIVKHINSDKVKMDFNHPMAGNHLFFSGKVIEIREATDEELQHGHAHYPGSCEGCDTCGGEGGHC